MSASTQERHVDALANVIARRGFVRQSFAPRDSALDVLNSTDPSVHSALAESIPVAALLDELVRRGVLGETSASAPDLEHIDAVVTSYWPGGPMTHSLTEARRVAEAVLTDPRCIPALLDALTRHGVLTTKEPA